VLKTTIFDTLLSKLELASTACAAKTNFLHAPFHFKEMVIYFLQYQPVYLQEPALEPNSRPLINFDRDVNACRKLKCACNRIRDQEAKTNPPWPFSAAK